RAAQGLARVRRAPRAPGDVPRRPVVLAHHRARRRARAPDGPVTQQATGPDASAPGTAPGSATVPPGPTTARSTADAHQPRTPRQWATLAVGVVVLVALCLVAGRWQWNRYVARETQIAQIEANYTAEPVPFGDVLSSPGTALDEDDV